MGEGLGGTGFPRGQRFRARFDILTGADRLRCLEYEHDFLGSWEIAFQYYRDGILDGDSWEGWDTWHIREMRSRPHFAWAENRHNFTPGPSWITWMRVE